MKATAGGTLIGPGADAIAIRNLSAFPIRVKQMDTIAEAPFNLVDDVDKSSGSNDFMMTVNGAAAKQAVELPDDGTWAMGYAGNAGGTDVLPLTLSGAKIARVTEDLSAAKKAATVTWTVKPTAKAVEQPGATEPGGGDTGTVSETVKTAIAKDAADWTLDEQQAVAEDISAKGETSPAYSKAKAAMDASTTWSMNLTNGKKLTYRIIGIDHDDLADGTGKAGLTFLTTSTGIESRMNEEATNVGGWEKTEIRQKMNSGEIWNLMPSDFQFKVKAVTKLTNNVGGGEEETAPTVTSTVDKLFLLSCSEVIADTSSLWSESEAASWGALEGSQYEAFQGKAPVNKNLNFLKLGEDWWLRTPGDVCYWEFYIFMNSSARISTGDADYNTNSCCPVFCF